MLNRHYWIKQEELKDCGYVCLATISKQHGVKIPIYKICELARTNKQRISAKSSIIKGSKGLGFSAKAFMAKNKEGIYGGIPIHAIAHVIMNKSYRHFAVIHKITDKYILVVDSGQGIIKYIR